MSSNRIEYLKSWSVDEEAISFLDAIEKSHKKDILLEQISAMGSPVHVGDQRYECATIIRAFKYFATSRTLYNRLREDYELPNVKALR